MDGMGRDRYSPGYKRCVGQVRLRSSNPAEEYRASSSAIDDTASDHASDGASRSRPPRMGRASPSPFHRGRMLPMLPPSARGRRRDLSKSRSTRQRTGAAAGIGSDAWPACRNSRRKASGDRGSRGAQPRPPRSARRPLDHRSLDHLDTARAALRPPMVARPSIAAARRRPFG